jgi:hypothetical protein
MAADRVRALEERVAQLEEELRQVKAEMAKGKEPEQPWWEKIAGMHEGDEAFAEIVRLGRKIRKADRLPEDSVEPRVPRAKRRKPKARAKE